MEKTIRILMADQDAVFRTMVRDYFELETGFQFVGGLAESQGIFERIKETKPQVLLLDAFLPPEGGLPVLKQIRAKWNSSQLFVIVISLLQDEALLGQASSLGADYYLLRPFQMEILTVRIKQLLGNVAIPPFFRSNFKQVQEICIRYFDLLGVPPHFKGYRYLLEGVWLAHLHPQWLNSVTGRLYPAIGKRFNTSGEQVERAMRYALNVTWERGAIEQLYRIFPYEINESKGKPTNSAFIAKMADLVNLELSGS